MKALFDTVVIVLNFASIKLQCTKNKLHQPWTGVKHTEVSESAFNNFNRSRSTVWGQGGKGTVEAALNCSKHRGEQLSFRRRTTFSTSHLHLALLQNTSSPGLKKYMNITAKMKNPPSIRCNI